MENVKAKPKGSWGRRFLWIALAFFGIVVVLAIIAPDTEAPAGARDTVSVTAADLQAAYSANEVAAQASYEGKDIRITGTIADITLDFMNEPVVVLATGDTFNRVQLDFDQPDAEKVGALAKGAEFTATCGEISEAIGNPMLDDCRF